MANDIDTEHCSFAPLFACAGRLYERNLWHDSVSQPRQTGPGLPTVDVTVYSCRVIIVMSLIITIKILSHCIAIRFGLIYMRAFLLPTKNKTSSHSCEDRGFMFSVLGVVTTAGENKK